VTQEQYEALLLDVFSGGAGQTLLTVWANRWGHALPATATDGELRHANGQRSVLSMILEGMANERRRRAAGDGATGERRGRRGRNTGGGA
jgi:hypothetical protein